MAHHPTVSGYFLATLLAFVGAIAVGPSPRDAAAHATTPSAATPTAVSADFSGLVDIGDGRRLFLECRGQGSPTVILEAGAGNNGQNWDTVGLPPDSEQTAVLPGVAAFTRVCAYDRPGTLLDLDRRSRSDPVPMPRNASDMVADLRALLTAAEIPGPYVLAGHSFGGLVARLYAATYPDEVVGLVLIDAAHEDYYDRLRAVLTPEQWATFTQPPAEPASAQTFEQIDVDASATAMREAAVASPLRPLPLVVITHGRPWDWPPDYPVEALEAVWPPLQESLATLSPISRLVVAEGSGHFIPGERPDLVVTAIAQVVEAVRDPGAWPIDAAAAPSIGARATPIRPTSSGQATPLLATPFEPPQVHRQRRPDPSGVRAGADQPPHGASHGERHRSARCEFG